MNNNKRILSFEDIENSIEIFGNKFELEFSEEYIKRLQNIDVKNIQDNNVFEALKEMLNKVLNDDNAYDKIKNSYETEKQKQLSQILNTSYEKYKEKYLESISENDDDV